MRSGEGKISLKSGFDKYLRIDKNGYLMGVSDAVGSLELFEPIWEDGKCAFVAANGKFLSVDDDDMVLCNKHSVGPMEVRIDIRFLYDPILKQITINENLTMVTIGTMQWPILKFPLSRT